MSADLLTALDGIGRHLERQRPASGLVEVHAEHHTHTRVLPSDVRLALPKFDVRITKLQDSGAVDSAKKPKKGVSS